MTDLYQNIIYSLVRAKESNFFTEENFYILHWLYRIRKEKCSRGIRPGFIQPDFLWVIFRPMMQSKKRSRTNADIRIAVNLWCSNRAEAEEKYGHISDWDVSSVTDMSKLFMDKIEFNDDMSRLFMDKAGFNDDISCWNVSNVTNMSYMFYGTSGFNRPIGNWNVSNVTDMRSMFMCAHSFNEPIGNWEVSNVTNMAFMFSMADVFNQAIGDWNVSNVTNMKGMFSKALEFNQSITNWNIDRLTDDPQYLYEFY